MSGIPSAKLDLYQTWNALGEARHSGFVIWTVADRHHQHARIVRPFPGPALITHPLTSTPTSLPPGLIVKDVEREGQSFARLGQLAAERESTPAEFRRRAPVYWPAAPPTAAQDEQMKAVDVAGNRATRKYSRRVQLRRALWTLATPLFFLSPRPIHAWRALLLRCFGAEIGEHVISIPPYGSGCHGTFRLVTGARSETMPGFTTSGESRSALAARCPTARIYAQAHTITAMSTCRC